MLPTLGMGKREVVNFPQALQRRHDERDGVSNHRRFECLLNRFFRAQIKENIKAPRHWFL